MPTDAPHADRTGLVVHDAGRAYVIRCPECRRENYAPAVARGQCAWCGWAAPAPGLATDTPSESDPT